MSSKFIDAHEAARWVASGDTVCTVGMTLIGAAESILSAIEARFLTAGEPRDLPLLQGTILVLAMFFVVLNLAVDVMQSALDPRIKR